jgi:hypothetical protein
MSTHRALAERFAQTVRRSRRSDRNQRQTTWAGPAVLFREVLCNTSLGNKNPAFAGNS